MFQDSNAADRTCINCPSDWKTEKKFKTDSCQTLALKSNEKETQVAFVQDVETQTESKKSTLDDGDQQQNPLQDPKFYKFISKAVPMLEAELDAAKRSRAFDGYQLLESEMDAQVRKLHTLDATTTRTNDEGLKVSAVTWSMAGSIIAVAFEAEEHENWCDHTSTLHIWNINRRDFDPGNAYKALQASACLTSAKFHPVEPSLIVAGGYSGEIQVWNFNSDSDPLIASSGVGSYHGHRDKISTISWIASSHLDSRASRSTYFVLSTGLDGILILWNLDMAKGDLIPTKKMIIEARHLPKIGTVRKKTDVGITCLSQAPDDQSLVVFGTESGAILEGSLTTPTVIHGPNMNHIPDLEGVNQDLEWHDPVKVTFQGHQGRVNDLKFSPFEHNVFLSCGSDQQIRIYSLIYPYSPVHVIPLDDTSAASLSWSWSRPLVFAAGCQNNKLIIFDLRSAKELSKATSSPLELKASEKLIPFPLTSVSFNARNYGLIATGDGFGRVHVWKLTAGLISKSPDENKILSSLGNIKED